MSAQTLPPLYIPASRKPVHTHTGHPPSGYAPHSVEQPPLYTSSGLTPRGTQTRATGHAAIRYARTTTTSIPDVDITKVTEDLGAAFRYVWHSAVDIIEVVTSAPVMAAQGLEKGVKGLPLPGHEGAAAWGPGPQRVGHLPSARDRQAVVAQASRGGTGKVRLATMATASALLGGGLGKPPSGRALSGGQAPPSGQALSGEAPSGGRAPSHDSSPSRFGGKQSSSPMARAPPSQPSQKLAGGTLGLPRAGYTTPPRSPSPARGELSRIGSPRS